MSDDAVERWTEVEPLPPVNGDLLQLLASVDTLRASWEEALSHVTPREFNEARQRSLRRHAIETGIIERLYDIDWSVTEALVAEGLTADVAAREGGWTTMHSPSSGPSTRHWSSSPKPFATTRTSRCISFGSCTS